MTRKTFRQVTQRFKRLPNIILLLAMVANLFLGVQSAAAEGESIPTIVSDKLDYAPGETVILTGTDWAAGEVVRIFVNDDIYQSWSLTSGQNGAPPDPIADANGAFIYSFQLPTWFVATYNAMAIGSISGIANTTFTDSTLPSSVKLRNWETKPTGNWVTATLGTSNSDFKEGETVPFQLDLGNLNSSNNPYYAPVCRDYYNSTSGPYGYTTLQTFDTSRSAVPGGTISDTNGAFSGVGIDITMVYAPAASSGTSMGIHSTAAARNVWLSSNLTSREAARNICFGEVGSQPPEIPIRM